MSIEQEIKTVDMMIRLYCRKKHGKTLCEDCSELLQYARTRLSKCPHGDGKPVCRNCKIHCYQKEMREKITDVMRFSGPRMMLHHPIHALRHAMREKKK